MTQGKRNAIIHKQSGEREEIVAVIVGLQANLSASVTVSLR